MSANYNQHTINKKILNKFEKPRAESDVLGPYGKYRDEYLKTYNRKREAFKKIARKYCQHNCQMLISCKDKKYDFEPDFAQILTEEKDVRVKFQIQKGLSSFHFDFTFLLRAYRIFTKTLGHCS